MILGPPSPYKRNYDYHITINDVIIERVGLNTSTKSFKFLGIEIDETLSWKYHIDKICQKIARANYIINKCKNVLPKACLKTLYQSLIQCHINYGLHIWGSSVHIGKIFAEKMMQKKSIRIINNTFYNSHTEPLFKSCKILTVKDQYTLNVALFMHQLKWDKLPSSFKDYNYFDPCLRPTRQIDMASHYNRARTTFTSQLPYHKFPLIWNNLRVHLRTLNSFGKFKSTLSKDLFSQYSNHIICNNRRC